MSTLLFFIPIATVLAVYFARIAEVKTKRDVLAGPVKENLTLRLFVLTGTVAVIGSITEYSLWRSGHFFWWIYALGVGFAAFSFWLRRAAIAALGRFWSLHVEIRENHEFVSSGPFRFVRHPTYFSMVMELLAFCLICNAYVTLCVVPLLFVPALMLRLRLEEAALVEKFGDTYRGYQRRTPLLFPYRWPRPND